MISYEPLWNTMEEKGISQYNLIKEHNFSSGQLSRIRSNNNISTHTMDKLCGILDCDVQDIVKHIKD